jgi:two-component system, NarL family, sensor kinase
MEKQEDIPRSGSVNLYSGDIVLFSCMYKILIIFIVLLFFAAPAKAQAGKIDSLLRLLPLKKEDTAKANLLSLIGMQYENNDAPTARKYYREAGILSQKLNDQAGYYRYLINYGSTFMVTGQYDSSLFYMEQSLAVAKKMKDTLSIGLALFNIGIAYRDQSAFEKAIEYCLEGRKMIEGRGQEHIVAQVNDALQVLYYNRTQYDKAIEFGEMAVAQSRKLKIKQYLSKSLINLSLSYMEKNLLDKAHAVLQEALGVARELEDLRVEGVALQNLAGIAVHQLDFNKARKYTESSLALYRKIGSPDGEATNLRALAFYDLQQGKYATAQALAEQSLQISRANDYKREQSDVLRLLSIIAYATNDRVKGLEYDQQSMNLLEAMVKDVLSQQSSELEKKYETEKKEDRIKKLEAERKLQALSLRQKNIVNYALIGSAFILLAIAVLFYRNYRQKQALQQQRIAELEKEKQLTATEAVLKGEEQERTRLAKDLHDGLGGMLSGIKHSFTIMKGNLIMTPDNQQAFERSMDMLDSSIKEMRRVAHNMMPEALVKFGLDAALEDFCNDINQSGVLKVTYQSIGLENTSIEQITAITIYRIVQELINNTIKHAMATTAIVQVIKSDGQLAVTVEDDGKGFDTAVLHGAKGIGWTNIQSRVDFLKGKLDVQSESGKGTSVHIEFNQA